MGQRQGPWLLQFLADGTGTPLVQVHHSRGQLHRKRRDRFHPEISRAGFLLTRPPILCIDIKEIWFGIANGQILSNFYGVICPRHTHIFISG